MGPNGLGKPMGSSIYAQASGPDAETLREAAFQRERAESIALELANVRAACESVTKVFVEASDIHVAHARTRLERIIALACDEREGATRARDKIAAIAQEWLAQLEKGGG